MELPEFPDFVVPDVLDLTSIITSCDVCLEDGAIWVPGLRKFACKTCWPLPSTT
jgi:hypothetical protein